jgi:hypothetical protein
LKLIYIQSSVLKSMALDSATQTTSVLLAVVIICCVLPGIYAGELFAWHPLLMVVGFLGLASEGVIAAVRFRGIDGGPRGAAIRNHMWVQVSGTACVCLGLYAIYQNKVGAAADERVDGPVLPSSASASASACRFVTSIAYHTPLNQLLIITTMSNKPTIFQANHGKAHLTSLHGKVGALNIGLMLAAPALGALSFRSLGLITWIPAKWHSTVKWAHRMVGQPTLSFSYFLTCA